MCTVPDHILRLWTLVRGIPVALDELNRGGAQHSMFRIPKSSSDSIVIYIELDFTVVVRHTVEEPYCGREEERPCLNQDGVGNFPPKRAQLENMRRDAAFRVSMVSQVMCTFQ